MKKIVFLLFLTFFGITVNADSGKFALLGIPIEGTCESFCSKLVEEGCKFSDEYSVGGCVEYSGTVLGSSARITVFYDSKTKLVYKVIVDSSVKSERLIEITDQKYSEYSRFNYPLIKVDWNEKRSYSDGKTALVVDDWGKLFYYNIENLRKKIEQDVIVPVGINAQGYEQKLRVSGKPLVKKGYSYSTNIGGVLSTLTYEVDGRNIVTNTRVSIYTNHQSGNHSFRGHDCAIMMDLLRESIVKKYPSFKVTNDWGESFYEGDSYDITLKYSNDCLILDYKLHDKKRANGDI